MVVAIIAVLAALIFPTFASARSQARQTRCLANLHQLGRAIFLYLQDYDDRFPYGLDPFDRAFPEQWRDHFHPWTGDSYYERVRLLAAAHPTATNLDQVLLPYYSGEPEIWHCPDDSGWEREPVTDSLFRTFGSSYIYRTELALSQIILSSLPRPAETNILVDAVAWHQKGPPSITMLFADSHVANQRQEEYLAAAKTPIF